MTRRLASISERRHKPAPARIRAARPEEARRIHALITAHLEEGHLLPRTRDELAVHAGRFLVAVARDEVIACGELAPLSHTLAEIRSLVVDRRHRTAGVGQRLVDALRRQARTDGFERLCAFAHQPAYFVQRGFSIVPHVWLPEKIGTDCHACAFFRRCGQVAVVTELESAREERIAGIASHA
jgi:amino-acid N-acetyltransferase